MFNTEIYTNLNKYVNDGKGKFTYTGILLSSKINQKNGQDYKLFDMSDADWNGAWISTMGDTYLNTTEDLLEVINSLNRTSEVSSLQREIDRIWKQINEITASYVTYSYLEEHLSTYWQRKINGGQYIGYDEETYTVYAYDLPTYEWLEDTYTSRFDFEEYKYFIEDNYYNKVTTNQVAYQMAYEAILRVIAGANDKFDTLKEVADWIMEQNVWVEVPLQEILDALEIFQQTGEWPLDTYYTYDPETETYTPINNPNEIDTSGDTQYWKQENYLVELKKLMVRVDKLDDRVGDRIYDEEENFLGYTGLFDQVENLRLKDIEIDDSLTYLGEQTEAVRQIAVAAYNMGYNAYIMAYTAYDIAYTALETSFESIEKANRAYDLAYVARVKVGDETINAEYIPIEYDDIATYIAAGKTIFIYDEDYDGYFIASEPYDQDEQYYYFQEYQEGTGLTVRMERVEVKAQEALDTANVALYSSYESLFHLNVNNAESSYVKLGLHPVEFDGFNRDRILSITTSEASVNKHSGEIYKHGLINISTAFDIYSYASTWMMLFVDKDEEYPNQYPNEDNDYEIIPDPEPGDDNYTEDDNYPKDNE